MPFITDIVAVCEIELVFFPRPDSENSSDEIRYIKTTDNATIQHLRKYLAMRMKLDLERSEGKRNLPDICYCAAT